MFREKKKMSSIETNELKFVLETHSDEWVYHQKYLERMQKFAGLSGGGEG